jgi:crotonobetainyl-CoA:carnitine CoA-transferase CaiB-like acyl-CoA transferase
MNNLRGDKPEELGLDYASLSSIKPSIVCLHLTAYGRRNSRESWPGYDYLMQAEAGLMHLTGDPDRAPARMGAPSIIDHTTGLTSMVGLLSAIIGARASGIGCDVDTSLFDVALHQLGYSATWYLNTGHQATRQTRSSHFSVTPVQTFPTSDGWVFVMCMTDRFWRALAERLDNPEIGEDPRFASAADRTRHRDALTALLDADFRKHDTRYWMQTLGGILPIAPVLELGQALDNPFLRETKMVSTLEHPHCPDLRVLANPILINGQRLSQAVCGPAGADTQDILANHGAPDASSRAN